jgi:type I restriction enzyme S subunit
MNQTLEAMAQAIFKEWFVDFNFPGFDGELVEGLPKGWRMGKLGEIVDIKGGTTPSTTKEEYWNGEYYWTTPKDLSNVQSPVLIDTERKITQLGVEQISSGIMPKGTLLLSSRAPIGYLAISQVPISINQGYIAIQGKLVSNLFMLFWLKENMDVVKSKANGSTFQEINKYNFREIEAMLPSSDILEKFETFVTSIFNRIVENVCNNQTLTQLRDSLLPKLMSGGIKI